MDRQLIVQRKGEHYHLDFHNFMGSFEGHAIGKWLKLEEVEHPGEASFSALKPGQFYLENVMGRHPDLHAVVGSDRLLDVAKTADHFHVRVIEGEDLLPELPEEERVDHEDVNYLEYLDKQHESVIHKGPKAVVLAILVRAIPAAIVALGILVAARHMTDKREEVDLAELFRRAARPPVEQNAWDAFIDPDHSHELITSMVAIRYMDGERVLLKDGMLLQFAGIGDVRPMLEAARSANTVPKIHVTLRDGGVFVREILVGQREFGQGSWLKREAKLAGSAQKPKPGRPLENLDDIPEDLLGERCRLSGVLERAADGLRLDAAVPGRMLLVRPARIGGDLDQFLELFADGETEMDVIVTIDEASRADPLPARLLALSVQNYHLSLEG